MSLDETLLTYVRTLLVEAARPIPEELDENTSLLESGLLDSHSVLQLAIRIEEEVGKELELADIDFREEWDTVARIISFIERSR